MDTFQAIDFTEDKLILESFFENDIGGAFGVSTIEKIVELERR